MDADYTSPDFNQSALITIDVQRDFLDGAPFEIEGTSAVVPSIARLVESYRANSQPIVHVVRLYRPDGSNADLVRRRMVERGAALVQPGSTGAEVAEPLLPSSEVRLETERLLGGDMQRLGPQEWVMYKPRWGAFFGTELEAHLRRLGVSTLVFAGCNFPNCPRASIYQASERDFRVVAVTDAISGFYDRGRSELANIGVHTLSTAEILITAAQT